MNFRECRLRAIHEIFKKVDESISIQKTFLLLGGMRNAVYYFNKRGIKLLGLSGCGEINCPGVFDLFHIKYTKIDSDKFLNDYNFDDNKTNNIYIIPGIREMLNTDDVDLSKLILVGHSFFIVDSIRDERIYFKTIDDINEYYMHLNVFNKINNSREWIMEADFEVYKIDIEDLMINYFLHAKMRLNEKNLFIDNVNIFLDNSELIGDEGTIRLEGEQCYDIIINHLKGMQKKLLDIKETNEYPKFIKYVYVQLVNFKKYIAAGSDGYYRTEFYDILNENVEGNMYEREWENIISNWRKVGRLLTQITTMKYLTTNAIDGLEKLITEWSSIKTLEMDNIYKLKNLMAK